MVLQSERPILVTGAGGWVASHTIYQLLDRGYHVRGTVRNVTGTKYDFLKSFHPNAKTHLELVEADLLKQEGWKEAAAGCEYVLHVASPFTFSAKNPDVEVVKPAVEGVRNVFRGCLQNPEVKRIVQTSSVCSAAFGHPKSRYACDRPALDRERRAHIEGQKLKDLSDPNVNIPINEIVDDAATWNRHRLVSEIPQQYANWKLINEEDWTDPENVTGYELSKILAEKEAWKIVEEHNKEHPDNKVELTMMLPAFIFGPIFCADQQFGESTVHIKRILQRTYPVAPQINSCHVDVRDVARAHILGFEKDEAAGQRYLLACPDGNIDLVEQSQILRKKFLAYGFNVATMAAPNFLLKIGGLVSPTLKVAAEKTTVLAYATNHKAVTELGMTEWRSVSDALWSHCISMMKYGVVEPKKTPKEIVDQYTPY